MAMNALALVKKSLGPSEIKGMPLVELAAIMQTHGDLYSDLQNKQPFLDWAEEVLQNAYKGKCLKRKDSVVRCLHPKNGVCQVTTFRLCL